jgi:hypothetical protein
VSAPCPGLSAIPCLSQAFGGYEAMADAVPLGFVG